MRRERKRRREEEKRRNKKRLKEKRLGKSIYFLEKSPPPCLFSNQFLSVLKVFFRRIGEIFWFFGIKRIKNCGWGNSWQFPGGGIIHGNSPALDDLENIYPCTKDTRRRPEAGGRKEKGGRCCKESGGNKNWGRRHFGKY